MTYFQVRRVMLKNYRSIADSQVDLPRLAFLVGPNGSGKSNFLDALRLVSDSLRTTLDHALRERGGVQEVRRRSMGHPTHFSITLEFLYGSSAGSYSFTLGARKGGSYEVQSEDCRVTVGELGGEEHYFSVANGRLLRTSEAVAPPVSRDRLYLVAAAGLPVFRAAYDGLSSMGFYNLVPDRIRELQSSDAGLLLARDGSNIASVLARMRRNHPADKLVIEDYLSRVVPGVVGVDQEIVGPMETLAFRQVVSGSQAPWKFFASNVSDGTLRALGVLVALFQANDDPESGAGESLVGIEEPEVALHPAAAGLLRNALEDASARKQVLVTSHSPELLDDPELPLDSILAVDATGGRTRIGRLDQAGRYALKERLFTAGELLRLDQLVPDAAELVPLPGL